MIAFKNDEDRIEMLEALESNMNEEFRATLQYVCHRILAKETDPLLAESFKSAALDEMAHILFFSDLITKYGGTPKLVSWEVDKSIEIVTMLKRDIELEMAARERYLLQLERFKDYPEFCTLIKSVLADEDDHEKIFTHELNKIG